MYLTSCLDEAAIGQADPCGTLERETEEQSGSVADGECPPTPTHPSSIQATENGSGKEMMA